MAYLRRGISWAGLAAGALAWAISTQVNYVFATIDCPSSQAARIWTVALWLAIAGLGTALSWPAWTARNGPAIGDDLIGPQPRRLLAGVSVIAGLLFALVILTHGAGVLMFGCER